MASAVVKIGIVGVGKMGGYHLTKFLADPGAEVVGIHDPSAERAAEISAKHGVSCFGRFEDLLFEIDALVIAAPTSVHHALARAALEAGVHVLVEKPIAQTVEEALDLSRLAAEKTLILQVGLIERFRCRALAEGVTLTPVKFIEGHRLSPTRPREGDIDVVSDLMIHDLDLALSLVGEEPSSVSAIGVAVLTPHVDIANVRLEFPGGAVVNLSASRVSAKPLRKFRFFAADAYASMDFAANAMEYYRRTASGIEHHTVEKPGLDALQEQASHFLHCIRTGDRPLVNGADGALALKYAELVRARIAERLRRFAGEVTEPRRADVSAAPLPLAREMEPDRETEPKPWA